MTWHPSASQTKVVNINFVVVVVVPAATVVVVAAAVVVVFKVLS